MNTVAQDNGTRQQRTLLIIDDDAEWTELLAAYFLGKYHVKVVNFAADAIEIARKENPGVIIVDLVMPTIDGFGVIHRLNDAAQTRIPTILLTGWKTPEVEECAASVGCAAVLAKPVQLAVLEQLVAGMMSGSGASAAAAVH